MIWVYCEPKSSTAMVCGMCGLGKGKEESLAAPDRKLESQSGVLVPALRALAQPGALGRRGEAVAPDAVEGRPSALPVEPQVVPPVVAEPEREEDRGHE